MVQDAGVGIVSGELGFIYKGISSDPGAADWSLPMGILFCLVMYFTICFTIIVKQCSFFKAHLDVYPPMDLEEAMRINKETIVTIEPECGADQDQEPTFL